MTDDILNAAREAVLDAAVDHLLGGVHDGATGDLRDWLVGFAEWQALGWHLLRTADSVLAVDPRRRL